MSAQSRQNDTLSDGSPSFSTHSFSIFDAAKRGRMPGHPFGLNGLLAELATLAFGEPAPDAEPLVVGESVFEALHANLA